MKYFLLLIATLACWLPSNAQVIRGRITDINGAPISSASLFIRELRMGAAANDDGYYQLRTPEGIYTCVFQCLGYETETVVIEVGNDVVEHNVVLRETAFFIPEVVVSNNRGEDPAYAMIRHVIAMAPFYMNQVAEYKAEAYLKGALHVGRISPLVRRLAREELAEMNIKEGNTYLEESINEIEFAAPNIYRQRVVRRTGSLAGENSASNNAMALVTASLYDEKAFEPVISPLSTSSFAHYRFRYEGFFYDGDRIINKIRIIPRRNSRQLFSGYVHIADGYWNVHSADVSGEFMMGIKYRMRVNFGEVNKNVWMPVSYHFDFDASILGNRGAFNYVASMKYTHLVENTSLRKPDALLLAEQQRQAMQQLQTMPTELSERTATATRTSERIENLLERENLTNRQAYQLARLMQREAENKENQSLDVTATLRNDYRMTVDSAANVRDTVFWEMMRPMPLNPEEMRSYQERDIRLADAPQQSDLLINERKSETPFKRITGRIISGHNFRLARQSGTIRYHGLMSSQIGFNTVDGFYVGQKLTYTQNFPQQRRLTIVPDAAWAINREQPIWNVDIGLNYAPMRLGNANIKFGRTSADFNGNGYIHPFENAVSSLFFRYNYLKLYEDNYLQASNNIDIANGIQLHVGAKYSRRIMLDNHSNYSFFYHNEREYTPNTPVNAELAANTPSHNAAIFTMNVLYTPRHYYRIVGAQKRYVRSDFPTFSAGWRKGISGLAGSRSNFNHITLGIRQRIEPGLMQEFRYTVRAGAFVNRKEVFFPDYVHFLTTEIPVTIGSISSNKLNLLEYYRFSTSDKYIQAHLNYNTPFLFLKLFPFFSNRMLWTENIHLNYLYTPKIKNYKELGYTIGIQQMCEAGVFVGFENFKYRSYGVKAALIISGGN